jgi:NitT/TauT family transport system ATP-binding protein
VSAPKLEVVNLRKSFRGANSGVIPVIDDLSLAIDSLEFVALLGPSGCGKSTLLRIIDGLLPPDSGEVLMNGRGINGPGRGRGMVFQGFELFPWRTALKNVEFGMQMLGVGRRERRDRARHWIELMGLREFEDSYPHQLSGGMQQRVGIARALAIEPEVLLMDEPFGSLDVQTRDLLQDELLSIWQRDQKTVLFVTHSIEEALYLADRVVVFTPRPARMERVISVPFPRPREERVKTSPQFVDMRRDIWHSLRVA